MLPHSNLLPKPELYHVGDVERLNVGLTGQTRNRADLLRDPMVVDGAQVHLLHRSLRKIGAGWVNSTKLTNFTGPHIGIGL